MTRYVDMIYRYNTSARVTTILRRLETFASSLKLSRDLRDLFWSTYLNDDRRCPEEMSMGNSRVVIESPKLQVMTVMPNRRRWERLFFAYLPSLGEGGEASAPWHDRLTVN